MDKIFVSNIDLDVAYKTTDGNYFYTERQAKMHAASLKNKSVKKLERNAKQQEEPEGSEAKEEEKEGAKQQKESEGSKAKEKVKEGDKNINIKK